MNETGVLFLTGTIIAELRWNVEGRWDIKTQHTLCRKGTPMGISGVVGTMSLIRFRIFLVAGY
jgi:hypothetical protein